jgi:hypothetical protein
MFILFGESVCPMHVGGLEMSKHNFSFLLVIGCLSFLSIFGLIKSTQTVTFKDGIETTNHRQLSLFSKHINSVEVVRWVTKRIELAIPSGTTGAQWSVINHKITSAANQGIELIVTVVH